MKKIKVDWSKLQKYGKVSIQHEMEMLFGCDLGLPCGSKTIYVSDNALPGGDGSKERPFDRMPKFENLHDITIIGI